MLGWTKREEYLVRCGVARRNFILFYNFFFFFFSCANFFPCIRSCLCSNISTLKDSSTEILSPKTFSYQHRPDQLLMHQLLSDVIQPCQIFPLDLQRTL